MRKTFLFLILLGCSCLPLVAQKTEALRCCPPCERRPSLTTSIIMEVYDETNQFLGILLFDQSFNPSKRLPAGQVQFGEELEEAAQRVALENGPFSLEDIKQFHVYTDFLNGCFHVVDLVHIARVKMPHPLVQDFSSLIYSLDQIPWEDLPSCHARILEDYILHKNEMGEKISALTKNVALALIDGKN